LFKVKQVESPGIMVNELKNERKREQGTNDGWLPLVERVNQCYNERRGQEQVGMRFCRRTTKRHPDRAQEEKTDQYSLGFPVVPSPPDAQESSSGAGSGLYQSVKPRRDRQAANPVEQKPQIDRDILVWIIESIV
jgi:hypothetical protein